MFFQNLGILDFFKIRDFGLISKSRDFGFLQNPGFWILSKSGILDFVKIRDFGFFQNPGFWFYQNPGILEKSKSQDLGLSKSQDLLSLQPQLLGSTSFRKYLRDLAGKPLHELQVELWIWQKSQDFAQEQKSRDFHQHFMQPRDLHLQ